MTTALITIMLVVANVMGAGMAYPQASRIVRERSTAGVSGVWAGVSLAMNIWWLVYGISEGLWGLVPVSGAAAALYVVIIAGCLRVIGAGAIRPVLIGLFVLGLVPLPFLILGGWQVAGLAIGLCYGMQLVPAVVTACRSRDLTGLAPTTWIMAWIEAVIWLAYGLIVADPALLAGGISGAVMAAIILARLSMTGHRPFALTTRSFATT